jgi:hypothetical protein
MATKYGPIAGEDRLLIARRKNSEMDYGYPLTKPKTKPFARPADGFAIYTKSNVLGTLIFLGEVGFVLDDDSPPDARDRFYGRMVQGGPAMSDVWNRAKSWIDNCDSTHKYEHLPPTNTELPDKVLDLRKGSIRLWETFGSRGRYTTLSYRWDTVETRLFKTTNKNFTKRKQSISLASMPQTFQDAIDITKKLDIDYLWIDALCIIQGDKNDWKTQSPKMGQYYSNSYLTITAAASTDSREGVYIPRNVPFYGPIIKHTEDGVSYDVRAFGQPGYLAKGRNSETVLQWEPISGRGWPFQERTLSCRSLIYASDQMYFECMTEMVGENGFWMPGRIHMLGQKDSGLNAVSRDGSVNDREIRRFWNQLMSAYSGRSLRHFDKLPAVSGLAKLFQTKLKNEYCAGLWNDAFDSLIDGLLWESTESAGPWEDFQILPITHPTLEGNIVPHRGPGPPSEAYKVLSNIVPILQDTMPGSSALT